MMPFIRPVLEPPIYGQHQYVFQDKRREKEIGTYDYDVHRGSAHRGGGGVVWCVLLLLLILNSHSALADGPDLSHCQSCLNAKEAALLNVTGEHDILEVARGHR